MFMQEMQVENYEIEELKLQIFCLVLIVIQIISTFNNSSKQISLNQPNVVFNNEKNVTISFQNIIEELTNIEFKTNINDFFSQIQSIINHQIDSNFMAVGLWKEKSKCIN